MSHLINKEELNDLIKRLIFDGKIKNRAHFAEKLGYTRGTLSGILSGKKEISQSFANKVSELFGDCTDCGELEDPIDPSIMTGKVIPLYDVEAAAGNFYGMNMDAVFRPVGMIEIGGLLKDSESALRVYGNSMTPNYPAGCVLGLRAHHDSFIEPGRVYVIETDDNRYLKRLYNNKDNTALRCVSDNHLVHDGGPMKGEFFYPDFEIPLSEVRRLFRVVGVIKRNSL